MAYDPRIFNINPYYDDFDANNGFLRVLFKPGYALQARELTQLQTILQDQISKIGDHLFKDGSRIVGGGISVRNASYIRVTVGTGTPLAGITDYSTLVGGVLRSSVAGDNTEAKIVHYIAPDADYDNYLILVVDFISGTSFASGAFNFVKDSVTLAALTIPTTGYETSGNCKLITVSEGIFYVDGFFARTTTQHFTPYATSGLTYRDLSFSNFSALSKKIGFSLTRDSITEQENSTLRDPAIGSYNYNAPGADRYTIVMTLDQAESTETPDDFVELLRFEDGRVTKKVDRITYGEIEKALARRTFDESGSYTVNPFDLTIKTGSSPNTLSVSVGTGKAYVLGHEVDGVHPQSVSFSRARTIQSNSGSYLFSLGNYLGVCMGATGVIGFGETFGKNLDVIGNGSSVVKFRNASGGVLAEGRVHGAFPTPETTYTGGGGGKTGYHYRLYFYGITGNAANSTVGHIYTNAGVTIGQFLPQKSGSGATFGSLLGTDNSSLVYELQPGYAVQDVQSLSIYSKLISDISVGITSSAGGGNTYTISKSNFADAISSDNSSVFKFKAYGSDNTSSADISQISFVRSNDSMSYTPTNGKLSVSDGGNSITLNITAVPALFSPTTVGAVRAVVPIIYTPTISSPSTYRTKVSINTSTTFTAGAFLTDSMGRKYYEFSNSDVYSVSQVTVGRTAQTEYFELDDGQKETYYAKSRLYLRNSVANTDDFNQSSALSIGVSYAYFAHKGLSAGPFIGQHSYIHSGNPGFEYSKIPLYTNPRTGRTVSLANCLDFRHSSETDTTQILKPYGVSEFSSAEATTASYTHYLPRIDKLCVKSNPEDGSPLFFLIGGTPDLSPVAPPDPTDGLVLAVLTVPAYTHNPTDVVITTVDNRRYTMADIGKIEKRVDEVEVFAKLSLSESEIEARSLRTSANAAEPLKTSIFSDEFYGHSIGDVADNEHICSIDFERGELRPFFRTSKIVLSGVTLTGTTFTEDGLITLNYSEEPYITNTQYSKTVKINPSNTVNWLGFMKLSTQVDPYYDTAYRPVVKTNALMENDNWISSNTENSRGFGTQWNDWESLWTGTEIVEEEQDDIQRQIIELPHSSSDSAIPSVQSGNVRVGVSRKVDSVNAKTSNFIRARKLKNRIKKQIGSRVIDQSVVPYIPLKTSITATVRGLKPNATGLKLFFDGEQLQSGISTDANGSCVVTFGISAGRFLTGSRVVRISDSDVTSNSTIAAETVYHSVGVLEQRDSGSYSSRPPELRRQTTSSEAVSKDPFNRDIDSVESSHWSDPLSQTFFVDKKTNPYGVFLSSVSLYFSKKDQTLPVTVQIRPTVSGYPSPSVVIPFSTVTKLPAQVTANATSPVATEFKFSSPVYLEPGEYSLCILANSDDYELYAADSAINGLSNQDATIGRAGNNQLVGTLFSPQGIGPAVADNVTDLMFKMNRCEFVSSGSAKYSAINPVLNSQILNFSACEIVPTGTSLTRSVGDVQFLNRESVYLTSVFSGTNPDLLYSFGRGANTAVSPVLDTQTLFAAAVSMFTSTGGTDKRSSYVSRVVELPEQLASNGLAVFVDSNIPQNTAITVYYRTGGNGEGDIFSKPWQLATRVTPQFTSSTEIDFREVYHRVAPLTPFKSYQVRVDLTTVNANQPYFRTPAVRNIRIASFIQS